MSDEPEIAEIVASAPPRGELAGAWADLLALLPRVLDVLRRGIVASSVATIVLGALGVGLFAVAAFVTFGLVQWYASPARALLAILNAAAVASLAFALLQAGGLVVFAHAAIGRQLGTLAVLELGARRSVRVAMFAFFFFIVPYVVAVFAYALATSTRGDPVVDGVVASLGLAVFVWGHGRFVLLGEVVAVLDAESGFFRSIARARALSRGRSVLIFAATAIPLFFVLGARPSLATGAVSAPARGAIALAGLIAYLILRPAFAAAAYAIALEAPKHPDHESREVTHGPN